jgi:diacylglycerol O-acyltransferase
VSVRPADDEGTGTEVTFIIGSLGTDIEDPALRLAAISASTRAAKAHFRKLPREAIMQYTVMLMAPNILAVLTPLAGRIRPMFNVTVSNVPGASKPLYFRGSRMEASYPISMILHGIALNITCQSYADSLAFAFVGCRDSLPHLQNLAVYTADALAELEAVLQEPKAPGRTAGKTPRRKAAATTKRSGAGIRKKKTPTRKKRG